MQSTSISTNADLSQAKFYEGYSRYKEESGRYETWEEAVDRVMSMHLTYYKDKLNPDLLDAISFATQAYKEQRILGAQRALQFGGDQLLKHQMRLYNCTSSYADRPEFFGECFYILLCGSGAGFSVQKHHVAKLPKIQNRTKQPKTYVIEDSIEGWASSLDVLLSSYFVGGGKHPEYEGRKVYFDLSQIRPRGAKISGGFKAPGPEPLRLALDRIEHLLQGLVLKKETTLRPIHVYDIVMHSSDAVLAGGVRRSATICLFSKDDKEMATAKTGNWFAENPQRARSNNSAVILRSELTREEFKEIMTSIKEFGEPGFFFVDDLEATTNPCVEIGMFPQLDGVSGWQGCNLTEINGSKCTDKEEFFKACKAAAILGTLQAGYTDFKFVGETTKKIFDREALLGVSITGWMNNPNVLFNKNILAAGAKIVKETNKQIAALIGINPAARTTCAKPSGNASVLLQTASGIHPEHSKRYLRNVQLNVDSEVSKLISEFNPYMVEDSIWSANKTDIVASFPIIPNEGSLTKKDIHGVEHLDFVKKAQKYWVEEGTNLDLCVNKTVRHNISNTIAVSNWDDVEKYIFDNREYFAGIALIADTGDKDYYQAPFTEVLTVEEIVDKYGTGSVFASGLIVDCLKVFNTLWEACDHVKFTNYNFKEADGNVAMKHDWVRRYIKFANNYFDGNITKAEHCLKDVFLLHKWEKIQKHYMPVVWNEHLTEKKFTDIDTTGAAACVGNKETAVVGCLL